MGRAIPIADFVILRQLLFQREAIERRPLAVDFCLFLEIVAAAQKPIRPVRRFLFALVIETERPAERPAAEADVGDVRPLGKLHQKHHMTSPDPAGGLLDVDPRGQAGDVEPERFQRGCEEPILFEAISAALVANELALERRGIEMDAALEQRIEILETYCGRMQRVERAESLERRRAAAGIADPLEIGAYVDGFVGSVHYRSALFKRR